MYYIDSGRWRSWNSFCSKQRLALYQTFLSPPCLTFNPKLIRKVTCCFSSAPLCLNMSRYFQTVQAALSIMSQKFRLSLFDFKCKRLPSNSRYLPRCSHVLYSLFSEPVGRYLGHFEFLPHLLRN